MLSRSTSTSSGNTTAAMTKKVRFTEEALWKELEALPPYYDQRTTKTMLLDNHHLHIHIHIPSELTSCMKKTSPSSKSSSRASITPKSPTSKAKQESIEESHERIYRLHRVVEGLRQENGQHNRNMQMHHQIRAKDRQDVREARRTICDVSCLMKR